MLYQRRLLSDMSDIGEPGPLPQELVGLTDESLADLSAAISPAARELLACEGHGFFPVPEAAAPRRISRIAFLQRIATAKRIAIRTAAKTDPVIEDFLDLLGATDLIELEHADTLGGVQYLVAQGLLTQGEAEALVS